MSRLRPIALPTEHGGWSLVLEPVVLGLLVAFSGAGLLLGLAAFFIFLTRHPLELAWRDRRRGKRYPRTAWAERFAVGYGSVALLAGGTAFVVAAHGFWQPLLLAIPLAIVQLVYDAQNRRRELVPEVVGAIAIAAVAPAITLADGWAMAEAFALWGILIVRVVGTILYVRARLRLEQGGTPPTLPAQMAHGIGVWVVAGLAALDLAPWLAVVAMGVLLARSLHGLSRFRYPAPRAAIIGIQEVIFGAMTVILVALGY